MTDLIISPFVSILKTHIDHSALISIDSKDFNPKPPPHKKKLIPTKKFKTANISASLKTISTKNMKTPPTSTVN